jgi:TetR/AcrR family transcriptional regulator, repressor of fatR-cypB operon
MTPPRTATASRAATAPADKREAILEAALALFVERGFHGTAVPLVAERAGVGAGTIYRYFASKEQLVNELYRHWKQALASEAIAVIDPAAPPREQFHRMWRRLFDFARRHPMAYAFLELHHHGSYLDGDSRAVETRVVALATAFIERLQRDKVVKPVDKNLLMAIVYWAFVGLVRCGNEGKLVLDDQAIDDAEQCVWEAVRY